MIEDYMQNNLQWITIGKLRSMLGIRQDAVVEALTYLYGHHLIEEKKQKTRYYYRWIAKKSKKAMKI
jgi:DNA-binding transcriptional ArsR family regulator